MKRLSRACLVVLLCASSELLLAQSTTKTISLIIHTPGKGKPSLSTSDLVILDNDVKIIPIDVEPVSKSGSLFAIVVDASRSMSGYDTFIGESVVDIFDAANSPGSRGMLFTYADTLSGTNGFVSRAEAQQLAHNLTHNFAVRKRQAPIYEAVAKVAQQLGTTDSDHTALPRLIFLVTDGAETSRESARQDAVRACLIAHVTVIPIGLPNGGELADSAVVARAELADLANATGGRAIILDGPANLKGLVSDVMQSEYVVTFPASNSPGYHTIRMEIRSAPKEKLAVPRGYFVP